MMRCEHGQKITKFCITQNCHNKEAAGCEYCIRKNHFHLNNIEVMTQTDIDSLIRNLTLPTDIKFKSRYLQQTATDYLKNIRNSFDKWIDQAQNEISERLGFPFLNREGFLNTYKKLKQRQYRKLNAKELRSINEFSKSITPDTLRKQEINNYYEEVDWTLDILSAAETVLADITKLPVVKVGEEPIKMVNKSRLKQVYQSIKSEQEKRKFNSEKQGIQKESPHESELQNTNFVKMNMHIQNELKQQQSQKIDKKIEGQVQKQPTIIEKPNLAQQSPTYNQTKQRKEEIIRRLKRRKSSIDDQMDFKYRNHNEDKLKHAKQAQQDNNRLEKIEQEYIEPQEWSQYTYAVRNNGEEIQVSQVVKEDQNTQGHRSKLAKRTQQQSQNTLTQNINRQTTDLEKNEPINFQKQKVSDNQASENDFSDILNRLVDNILPPLPSQEPQNEIQESIKQRVVKIHMSALNASETDSPILLNRKKQQQKMSNPLEIIMMPTPDMAFQNKDKTPLKQQIQRVKQTTTTERQNQKVRDKELQIKQDKQDGLILLQKNQKNSLLLFCQALSSPADQAANLLRAALKYSPENLSAAQYLSFLYLQDGKAKQCIEVCDLILVHIKDIRQQLQLTLHLRNNKAAALNQLGRYSQSILMLQKCLRFKPKHYFYKNLGDAYFSLGILQKAAMNYEKAIKMDPELDEAFYNLAVTYFFQSQYTSAQNNIKQALKRQPQNQVYKRLAKQISMWRGHWSR